MYRSIFILTSALDVGVVSFTPRSLYPGEQPPHLLDRKVRGLKTSLDDTEKRKFLSITGLEMVSRSCDHYEDNKVVIWDSRSICKVDHLCTSQVCHLSQLAKVSRKSQTVLIYIWGIVFIFTCRLVPCESSCI
jgi:hypothetical protein